MRRQKLLKTGLFLVSVLLFAAAIWIRSGRIRLSDLRVSGSEAEKLLGNAEETDLALLKRIDFNGYPLFFDEQDSAFYYSLVENDSDAFDPLVRIQGRTGKVKVYLLDGVISPETVRQNRPLLILACDGTRCRKYEIRCTALPLMNIESEIESVRGTQKDRDLKMTLFDNRAEARQRLIRMEGLIHVRGNSSTVFPQLGYKMVLRRTSPGDSIREADVSLLGMDRSDGEWLLSAGYNDQERIRNVFSTVLWNRSCAGNNQFGIRNGLEYRFIELFMNGKYWGLYALGYPLDTQQMQPHRNADSIEALYLFKKTFWSEIYSDLPENLPMRDFEAKGVETTAEEEQARLLLREYDQWLRDGAPGEASEPSSIRPDMDNAVDTWLFVNLVQGADTVNRAGEYVNMFITMLRTDQGTAVVYTPWDLDLTWGNALAQDKQNATFAYGISPGDNSFDMLRNPAHFLFRDDPAVIRERYRQLRNGSWSDGAIDRLIADYEKQIFDSGAYRRDIAKWPGSSQTDPETGLAVFRSYVHDRLKYLDQFIGPAE